MNSPSPFGKALRRAWLGALGVSTLGALATGCLDRPVAQATPTVTARVTAPAKQNSIDKIDLLFMIDNSSSMADKQTILSKAVPDLVNRFVDPKTFVPLGDTPTDPGAKCPTTGAEREFHPLSNIHIGIITSSLGGHGAKGVCDDATDTNRTDPHNNDKGELITRGAATAPAKGFLDWSNGTDPTNIESTFQSMVTGTGQHGCGYEAQLEAPYRFLVDPEPNTSVVVEANNDGIQLARPDGIDYTVLQQRADFLRPDSLLAVILVTDENDCSIDDAGQGFLSISAASGKQTAMMHGSSACLTNPDDPCCYTCLQGSAPDGCPSKDSDPECQKGPYSSTDDPANLRCWNQKGRYGIDFLLPVSRYVNAFTVDTVQKRDGSPVKNPIFDDLTCPKWTNGQRGPEGACSPQPERDATLVFVAGIIGVPYQDIARDPNDLNQGFMTAKELRDNNIWPRILGPDAKTSPTDPLMIEAVDQRLPSVDPNKYPSTTTNPLGSAALPQPANSRDGANPINGHEWDISQGSPTNADLQYACIFDLDTPRDCSDKNLARDCDCVPGTNNDTTALQNEKNPLCYSNGQYSYTQVRAKGYPGVRELQVLQGLGDQGIVASICPKQLTKDSPTDQDYGYRPAVNALIERLRVALRGRCLPRQLEVDQDTNNVPCIVYEAFTPGQGTDCNCDSDPDHPGRSTADTSDLPTEISSLDPMPTCICKINQLTDTNQLYKCMTDPNYNGGSDSSSVGWCYVDPVQQANDAHDNQGVNDAKSACTIVQSCPDTEKRLIRFIGSDGVGNPRAGSISVIMCQEATFSPSGSNNQNQDICQ